ncbi:MAG: Zn-ribbon containing protein [Candidatus Nanoarchaeia archaeon]|nr:Zn-ribbon containing protein [Candidatus Nanoarchaeia archaeon]
MHQCVKCSEMYDDGAMEILKGCKCGGRFFFFMKKKDIDAVKEITVNLTPEAKEQLENDAMELVGQDKEELPVILDLESIRMNEPGKFEIDLIDLFNGKPLVFKLSEGKYIIDIVSTFDKDGDKR